MSILHPVPKEKLGTEFTHYGWMFGLVPVYIGSAGADGPLVGERNWVPEWWFSLWSAAWDLFMTAACAINPAFEPGFMLFVTGEIAANSGPPDQPVVNHEKDQS